MEVEGGDTRYSVSYDLHATLTLLGDIYIEVPKPTLRATAVLASQQMRQQGARAGRRPKGTKVVAKGVVQLPATAVRGGLGAVAGCSRRGP